MPVNRRHDFFQEFQIQRGRPGFPGGFPVPAFAEIEGFVAADIEIAASTERREFIDHALYKSQAVGIPAVERIVNLPVMIGERQLRGIDFQFIPLLLAPAAERRVAVAEGAERRNQFDIPHRAVTVEADQLLRRQRVAARPEIGVPGEFEHMFDIKLQLIDFVVRQLVGQPE
ncbi:hypothetical protein SDC9_152777 [bioreactor metagenome]|uniref:Uncharacterized protein n=1 Tax=bioreactor metagenome TaxID=1076179 RepID=A0A645EVS3_9ZZZZ